MPPKGKHKNANQHEKRHDTGLAAPGKRIAKDKPQPSSNGHANGKALQSATPPPLPSTGLNQGLVFPRPPPSAKDLAAESNSDEGADCARDGFGQNIPSQGTPEEDSAKDMGAPAVFERKGSEPKCGTETSTLRSIAAQASSSLALAATILSSCPLRDAIAILILLLSLPPTLIITVQTLFASLTFVPPTAGLSWASWTSMPSLSDWFHATPGGGPSPFTIAFFDAMMTMAYILCPLYLQNMLMDLGQAVIAISLSGASAGKGGPTNSIAFSSTIILASHLVRYNAIHLTGLDYARSLMHNLGLSIPQDHTRQDGTTARPPVIHGWPRILLGCHILAQGILTLLRRALAGTSQPRPGKRQDPEAVGYTDGVKSLGLSADVNPDTPLSASTDGRSPGPSPAVRDGKERVSNSKRRRKQANQVRSQQPLWAAIASTKVTFMKEMEQKQATNDLLETNLANGHLPKPGFTSKLLPDDKIWITDIKSTEITFKAELVVARLKLGKQEEAENAATRGPGIDRLKPFFIRLNGADWGSTRISGAGEGETSTAKGRAVWGGEIYGLTPLTKYSCEILRTSDQQVICSTSLITLPAPSAEQAVSAPAPPQHQALRPLSPSSTLKQSIAAAEARREEIRNKLRRTRKDHKSAATAVRREIDQLNGKVTSSGGQDERQRQRALQLKQHIKQAEEATVALKDELDALGEIPQADLDDAATKKQVWQAASDAKAAAAAELEQVRIEINKEISQLHAELASSAQKRERLNTRKQKLGEQHERLVSEQHETLTARQRHEQERTTALQNSAAQEANMMYWINKSRAEAENLNIKANEYYQQIEFMQAQLQRQQAAISSPTTPEGDLPGTNGPLAQAVPNFEFPSMFSFPSNPPMTSQNTWVTRGRSSSMLSGYSGFTDDLEAPAVNGGEGRKGSEGSSGSAGSVGEHSSPRPLMKAVGPLGSRVSSADDRGKGKARMSPIGSHR